MYSLVHPCFILPNSMLLCRLGSDNNSSEKISNPIRGTGTLVAMHGASIVDITVDMHKYLNSSVVLAGKSYVLTKFITHMLIKHLLPSTTTRVRHLM